MSDMQGSKALYLEEYAKTRGHSFLRFDYHGHGESSGNFKDGTIGRWKNGAIELIEQLTEHKLLLIGSSMGGWIALHAALDTRIKMRIQSLIGIAAAPDFTLTMWDNYLSDEQRSEIIKNGVTYVPNCYGDEPYSITKALIEDGKTQCLMNKPEKLGITCPVRLLQGMKDDDVPWQTAQTIANNIASTNTQIHYLKDADHRMSGEEELKLLGDTLSALIT